MALRSGNPTLNNSTFSGAQAAAGEEPMTLQGTVQKTAILLLLVVAASCITWSQARVNPAYALHWTWIWALTGFVVGLVTVFKKSWAPVTAPIYAVVEGLLLGVLSSLFELQYPGIVIQAVGLTFGTLASLLVAYRSGLIKATQNFRLGVVAATGGICILYLVDLGMAFFGHRIPMIHESGWVGIGFSAFVVVIAALNLVLDFDFIERGAQSNQPKYMEWYAGFGLIVTLIWLYLEILRLLAKTSRRPLMKSFRLLGLLFLCCFITGNAAWAYSSPLEQMYPKFGRLKEDMTKEQVIEIAGKPASVMSKPEEHTEYWFYIEPHANSDGRIAFVDIVTVKIQGGHFVSVDRIPYSLQPAAEF